MSRLLARLLVSLAPPDVRQALLADLEEAYARRVASHGRARARLWYASQILSGIVPLLQMRRQRWNA